MNIPYCQQVSFTVNSKQTQTHSCLYYFEYQGSKILDNIGSIECEEQGRGEVCL